MVLPIQTLIYNDMHQAISACKCTFIVKERKKCWSLLQQSHTNMKWFSAEMKNHVKNTNRMTIGPPTIGGGRTTSTAVSIVCPGNLTNPLAGIWSSTPMTWSHHHCQGILIKRLVEQECRNCLYHMGQIMQIYVLCHVRTTKVQISLRIRTVWSAPLFSLLR